MIAKDLISRTLVPDPQKRIKLSDMKIHSWMNHPDSGPTPSKADYSVAMNGITFIYSNLVLLLSITSYYRCNLYLMLD